MPSRSNRKTSIAYDREVNNERAKPFAWTKSEVHQKRLKARFADQ
jgi:hypothetical protein